MNIETETQTEIQYPFTATQCRALTPEQRQSIEAVAEYLSGNAFKPDQTDEEITNTLNLLKACIGSVPPEEAGEDLLNTIRQKLGAVYEVGLELAQADLKAKKITNFRFCSLIDPSYENASHIAIVDSEHPICFLNVWIKAWHLGFSSLPELADDVLQIKKQLVHKAVEFSRREIFVIIEGGVVHEIVNLPPNLNVAVIDYDTEGVEKDRLEISPVDGELCVINKW